MAVSSGIPPSALGACGRSPARATAPCSKFFEAASKAANAQRPHTLHPHCTHSMPQTKATRKFEKNRLPDLLKKRKEVAKIKQKQQIKAKRKERKAKDNERAEDVEDAKPRQGKKEAGGNPFGDMSVDEFFQGGFDIPEDPKKKGRQGAKHKEVPAKTGKRKRTQGEENDEAASSPAGFGEEEAAASDAETDSEADLGVHKQELDALAKKDPEFFKYLQENDRELLDFEEDADLAGIDALSDSEDEGAPKKKQKKDKKDKKHDEEMEDDAGNEVTKAMVKKWRTAMTEQHSLRATREVVLAFRAAAHLNEEDDKQYKYSISNPDGRIDGLYFCSESSLTWL